MARHFVLNTGAKIPSVGLGTWQSDPGVVGQAVYAAVKVRLTAMPPSPPLLISLCLPRSSYFSPPPSPILFVTVFWGRMSSNDYVTVSSI